jgi:hypothetical protein
VAKLRLPSGIGEPNSGRALPGRDDEGDARRYRLLEFF